MLPSCCRQRGAGVVVCVDGLAVVDGVPQLGHQHLRARVPFPHTSHVKDVSKQAPQHNNTTTTTTMHRTAPPSPSSSHLGILRVKKQVRASGSALSAAGEPASYRSDACRIKCLPSKSARVRGSRVRPLIQQEPQNTHTHTQTHTHKHTDTHTNTQTHTHVCTKGSKHIHAVMSGSQRRSLQHTVSSTEGKKKAAATHETKRRNSESSTGERSFMASQNQEARVELDLSPLYRVIICCTSVNEHVAMAVNWTKRWQAGKRREAGGRVCK